MGTQNNSRVIIDSALIVAFITVWAYVIAFVHAFAYCTEFNIPVDYASLEKMEMVFPAIGVIIYVFLIYSLLNYVKKGKFNFLKMAGDNSERLVTLALLVLFSVLGAYLIGFSRANSKRTFMMVQEEPKLVVWYRTGDMLFCEQYDKEHKKLTGEFRFINIDDKLVLKKEFLGDIKESR